MRRLALSLSPLLVLAACVGDAPESRSSTADIELVDEDGDGVPDGIDLDGDGVPDLEIDLGCQDPLVDADGDGIPDGVDLDCDGAADIAWCEEPLIDDDGDGVPDGIDLNCDGAADVTLPEIPDVPDDLPDDLDDLPVPPEGCIPAPLDGDGDGIFDGVDLDCDGVADYEF